MAANQLIRFLILIITLSTLAFSAQSQYSIIGSMHPTASYYSSSATYSSFGAAGYSTTLDNAASESFWLLSGSLYCIFRLTSPSISNIQVMNADPEVNQPLIISADIKDDFKVSRATLYYFSGDEAGFDSLVNISPDLQKWTVPADRVTAKGLAYFIVAANADGMATTSKMYSVEIKIPAPGMISTKQIPAGKRQSSYRLISIPGRLENSSPKAIFEDDWDRYNDKKWRLFEFVSKDKYIEFNQISKIETGKAYWVILRESKKAITSGPAKAYSLAESFRIPVKAGWNLIGNPFNFSININNVESEESLSPLIYSYSGSWKIEDTFLQPFAGYAVYSETDSYLSINPLPPAASSLQKTASNAIKELQWSIEIVAKCQDAIDEGNIIGVAESALSGWDPFDQPEPPIIGEYVSLYFPHADWNKQCAEFSRDIRSNSTDFSEWYFQVSTNISDVIEINFKNLESIPEPLAACLIDEESNTVQYIKSTPSYRILGRKADNPKSLRLAIGSRAELEKVIGDIIEFPDSYILKENYPNPFNSGTCIQYGLPKSSRVNISVLNYMGQLVKTLANNETVEKGYHCIIWDGRDSNQNVISSGLYFLQFQADNYKSIRKMTYLR